LQHHKNEGIKNEREILDEMSQKEREEERMMSPSKREKKTMLSPSTSILFLIFQLLLCFV
jgi:hypothetical protein